MDFSQLDDNDISALRAGNFSGMSDRGFAEFVKQRQAALSKPEREQQMERIDKEKYSPTSGMSTADLLFAGAGKYMTDVGRGVAQRVGAISPEEVAKTRERDAPLMATTAGKAGHLAGAFATALPLAIAPGANTAAGAGAYGALQGFLQPTTDDESAYGNAALGGLGGLAGYGAAKVGSNLLAPKVPTDTANLVGQEVPLTIGQRLGGGFKRAEDALTSVPGVGDMIRNKQRESIQGFNSAVANRALSPIGQKLPKGLSGHDAVMHVERAIGDAYDDALKGVGNVQRDSQFATELAILRRMVKSSTLPKDVQAQFEKAIKSQIEGKFQGQGVMTAETFKTVESELGRLASKYGSDVSADKQLLGDALEEAQASLRGLLERSAGPKYSNDVKAANRAWAEFKRMQKASSFLGAEDGVFSPENYLNAVKALDKSKDKGAFARGNALGQDLAQDAVRVLGRKVPDSGTPFRSITSNPGKAAIGNALLAPIAPAYTTSGRNLLQSLASGQRSQAMQLTAEELNLLAPYAGALGIAASTR